MKMIIRRLGSPNFLKKILTLNNWLIDCIFKKVISGVESGDYLVRYVSDQWRRFGGFIANLGDLSRLFLVFLFDFERVFVCWVWIFRITPRKKSYVQLFENGLYVKRFPGKFASFSTWLSQRPYANEYFRTDLLGQPLLCLANLSPIFTFCDLDYCQYWKLFQRAPSQYLKWRHLFWSAFK